MERVKGSKSATAGGESRPNTRLNKKKQEKCDTNKGDVQMTAIAPKKRGRKRAKKLSDYDDSESDVFQKSDDVQSKKSKCGKKKPKYDDLFDPDLLYNSFDSDVESVASELKELETEKVEKAEAAKKKKMKKYRDELARRDQLVADRQGSSIFNVGPQTFETNVTNVDSVEQQLELIFDSDDSPKRDSPVPQTSTAIQKADTGDSDEINDAVQGKNTLGNDGIDVIPNSQDSVSSSHKLVLETGVNKKSQEAKEAPATSITISSSQPLQITAESSDVELVGNIVTAPPNVNLPSVTLKDSKGSGTHGTEHLPTDVGMEVTVGSSAPAAEVPIVGDLKASPIRNVIAIAINDKTTPMEGVGDNHSAKVRSRKELLEKRLQILNAKEKTLSTQPKSSTPNAPNTSTTFIDLVTPQPSTSAGSGFTRQDSNNSLSDGPSSGIANTNQRSKKNSNKDSDVTTFEIAKYKRLKTKEANTAAENAKLLLEIRKLKAEVLMLRNRYMSNDDEVFKNAMMLKLSVLDLTGVFQRVINRHWEMQKLSGWYTFGRYKVLVAHVESLDEILFDQRPAFFPRLVELTFGLDYVLTHVVVGRDEQPFLEETAGNDIISFTTERHGVSKSDLIRDFSSFRFIQSSDNPRPSVYELLNIPAPGPNAVAGAVGQAAPPAVINLC